MSRKHRDKLIKVVDELCEKHNLEKPLTVVSAANIIIEHKGVDKALKLYNNAWVECERYIDKDNPFAFAAYKSTLNTIIIPAKKKELLEAYFNGKTIQSKHSGEWKDFIPQNQLDKPNLDYGLIDYWRIKS